MHFFTRNHKKSHQGKCRKGMVVVLSIIVISTLVAATGLFSWHLAAEGPLEESKTLEIGKGMTLNGIGTSLEEAGIVKSAGAFTIPVRLLGMADTLQAGEYTFPAHISIRQVINKLATGDIVRITLVIPEGYTLGQMEDLFEVSGYFEEVDVPDNLPEGALFPDTYEIRRGQELQTLLETMQKRLVEELNMAWEKRDSDAPYATPAEMLVMASIIQKEAANEEEMPTVAGVFANRLNQDMKLQSDPTVIYGASDYDGDITTMHLREDHPYNTYIHKGLPPGPIASAGRAALMAAARPESHDYLFFVADGEGGHSFAITYEEHLENVEVFNRRYREKFGK